MRLLNYLINYLIPVIFGVFGTACNSAKDEPFETQVRNVDISDDVHTELLGTADMISDAASSPLESPRPLCESGTVNIDLAGVSLTLNLNETESLRKPSGQRYSPDEVCGRQATPKTLLVKSAKSSNYYFSEYRDINFSEWDADKTLSPYGTTQKTVGLKDIYNIQRQDPEGVFRVINMHLECTNRPAYNGNCRLASSFDEKLIVQSIFNRDPDLSTEEVAAQVFQDTLSIRKIHNIRM